MQGLWSRDPSFIPPMLSVAASPVLVTELGDLLVRLQARRKRLMAMRRESNERLADFAVADVSLFWLLNALNSTEPVLTELLQTPGRHPELLYRELTRLAGSLLTFSLEHDAGDIPVYRHDAPERVFPPLLTLLDKLLEASLPPGLSVFNWSMSIRSGKARCMMPACAKGPTSTSPYALQCRTTNCRRNSRCCVTRHPCCSKYAVP
jgi:predicted component of type VI protein secretion system